MDGQEELSAAIIGGLDSLVQVCSVGSGFVHCGVVDCVPELLQFGDQGCYNGSVDLALTEAFINGAIAWAGLCVPCVDAYLNGQHLLSFSMDSDYKRQVYYFIFMCSIAFHPLPNFLGYFLGKSWIFIG